MINPAHLLPPLDMMRSVEDSQWHFVHSIGFWTSKASTGRRYNRQWSWDLCGWKRHPVGQKWWYHLLIYWSFLVPGKLLVTIFKTHPGFQDSRMKLQYIGLGDPFKLKPSFWKELGIPSCSWISFRVAFLYFNFGGFVQNLWNRFVNFVCKFPCCVCCYESWCRVIFRPTKV